MMAKCCDQMSPDYAPACEGLQNEAKPRERGALPSLSPHCALPRVWSRNCEIKTMNALSKMYGVRAWQDAGLAMITGRFIGMIGSENPPMAAFVHTKPVGISK